MRSDGVWKNRMTSGPADAACAASAAVDDAEDACREEPESHVQRQYLRNPCRYVGQLGHELRAGPRAG